jgi:hypothetical protein
LIFSISRKMRSYECCTYYRHFPHQQLHAPHYAQRKVRLCVMSARSHSCYIGSEHPHHSSIEERQISSHNPGKCTHKSAYQPSDVINRSLILSIVIEQVNADSNPRVPGKRAHSSVFVILLPSTNFKLVEISHHCHVGMDRARLFKHLFDAVSA